MTASLLAAMRALHQLLPWFEARFGEGQASHLLLPLIPKNR